MKTLKLLLFTCFTIFQINAFGQITLELDNVPPNTLCNDVWTEENLDLSFTATTASDCTVGSCFFGIEPTFVWLFPSRMTVDLSTLQNITKVEIDITDFCGVNCTKAFLEDTEGMPITDTGNVTISMNETLILLNPTQGNIAELAVSSCEGQVHEIRIFQNLVSGVQAPSDLSFVSYPNPGRSNDDLHVRMQIDSRGQSLERIDIFTFDGTQVYSMEVDAIETSNEFVISAADLPKGVCILRFKAGDTFYRQRIIRL